MLKDSINDSLKLIQEHWVAIVATLATLIFSYIVYRITMNSLKKLKTEILSSYPFDLFIPKNGSWSIFYFLTVILFLGAIIYLMVNGGFYVGPA